MGDLLFILIVFFLLILFVISFALFIRRMLIHSNTRNHSNKSIEEKLDRIIELLEKNN